MFYPWEECKPLLDAHRHASFSRPRALHDKSPPTSPQSTSDSFPVLESKHSTGAVDEGSSGSRSGVHAGSNPPSEKDNAMEGSVEGETNTDEEESEDEEDGVVWPNVPPPGFLDPQDLPKNLILVS